jgi:hypothetical protein
MSAITDFRDQLVAGSLSFTGGDALATGSNLFVGLYPVSPNNAVLLTRIPTPGPERVMGTGQGGVVWHTSHVSVNVRSQTYTTAEQMMRDIITRMDNFVGQIGANYYFWISQRVGVSEWGQDENKRFRFTTSYLMHGPIP